MSTTPTIRAPKPSLRACPDHGVQLRKPERDCTACASVWAMNRPQLDLNRAWLAVYTAQRDALEDLNAMLGAASLASVTKADLAAWFARQLRAAPEGVEATAEHLAGNLLMAAALAWNVPEVVGDDGE